MVKKNAEKKYGKIQLIYKYDPAYRVIFPTDAYGGMNPKGKLVMNLFTDMFSIPIREEHKLDKNMQINRKIPAVQYFEEYGEESKNQSINYDRMLQETLIISPDDAINIGLFMIETIIKDPNSEYDLEKLEKHFARILGEREVE